MIIKNMSISTKGKVREGETWRIEIQRTQSRIKLKE